MIYDCLIWDCLFYNYFDLDNQTLDFHHPLSSKPITESKHIKGYYDNKLHWEPRLWHDNEDKLLIITKDKEYGILKLS